MNLMTDESKIESNAIHWTSGSEILITETLSESSRFRIHKARQGSRFVILKTAKENDSMSISILRREYELSYNLNHPSIVNILGFDENTPAGPAIIIEYINGTSLDKYLAKPVPVPVSHRKSILNDIMDGLEYLHHRGILHNDLKPENIIINQKGAARIIDFGLSEGEDSVWTGSLGGSADYTAPEILNRTEHARTASDIYSLGKITSFIFNGKKYKTLVRKCLKSNPDERPQTVAEFRKGIRKSEMTPYIMTVAIAIFAIGAPFLFNSISERIQIMSAEQRITSEINRIYEPYLKMLKEQQYKEQAYAVLSIYYKNFIPYQDSLLKLYPMNIDGTIPKELGICSRRLNEQKNEMESIINSKPSLKSLPEEEQNKLMENLNSILFGV